MRITLDIITRKIDTYIYFPQPVDIPQNRHHITHSTHFDAPMKLTPRSIKIYLRKHLLAIVKQTTCMPVCKHFSTML